jgi:hypothetical protein
MKTRLDVSGTAQNVFKSAKQENGTRHDALGTAQNESGCAKHEN